MALIVEDGSGVINANSFLSEAEIIDYAAMRGVVVSGEEALRFGLEAMGYIETQVFGGDPVYDTPFPRVGLILPNFSELPSDAIPNGVKKAQAQLALDAKNGVRLVVSGNPEPMIKRDKTGPLETEWFAPAVSGIVPNKPNVPIADAALAPYLSGNGGFRLKTYRA